jgi:ribonuclease HII
MKVLGIDEAGRGPCIGPLFICGYLIQESKIRKLKDLGVKDSKKLSLKQREALFPEIQSLADDFITIRISADEIDRLRSITNLNRVEIEKIQHIMNSLDADKVIIDSLERNVDKFKNKILSGFENNGTEIICENFADDRYPVVSAASVIAKVSRDREIRRLHKVYGFFGSGYPSDPETVNFLKRWIKENKQYPDIVRKSWITSDRIQRESKQTRLSKFFRGLT